MSFSSKQQLWVVVPSAMLTWRTLADVCHHACRYMADEARNLKQYKELPENSKSGLLWHCNFP